MIKKLYKMKHIKEIATLALPLMIGSVLQILMGTVDMIFVSGLGTEYAAAAAMGNSIAGVLFVLSMLISSGTMALIARKKGEGDESAISNFSGTSILLSIIIGGLVSVVAVIFVKDIIQIYRPDSVIANIIEEYLSIIFLFTFVIFLNTTLRTIVQSLGDTLKPLYIFGGANILNVLLDYLFIIVYKMGIRGAAIATVSSQSVACVLMLLVVINKIYNGSLMEFFKSVRFRSREIIMIFRIGIWACIQSIARPITGLIMMGIVYDVSGKTGSAAFGIGLTIINYFFIVLMGLSSALTIMVGHKIGEKNIEEAKEIVKEGLFYSFINVLIFSIPYLLFTEYLFIPFRTVDVVTEMGSDYLRIVYLGFIIIGYTFMYRGAFGGAGDTFPPMIAALFANVVCKLSFALIATKVFGLGINGVWYAILLSIYVEAFIMIVFYKKGSLYKKSIYIE